MLVYFYRVGHRTESRESPFVPWYRGGVDHLLSDTERGDPDSGFADRGSDLLDESLVSGE